MKFGFRTPSFKRSLSAATKGALKRAIMREIVPYYGKRGMGWSNPKKAAYNHLYNTVTANPVDVVLKSRNTKRVKKKQPAISPVNNCESEANSLSIYHRGLEQIKVPMALFEFIKGDILNDSPKYKAIRRLNTYVSGYLNKSMSCGYDYCDMCNERLLKLQRINPEVKDICLKIIKCVKCGVSAENIFESLSSNKSLSLLINEQQVIEDYTVEDEGETENHRTPIVSIAPISPKSTQPKEEMQTLEIVLRCIFAIVGFIIFIWLIVNFVFPVILFGLIFLSILFAKK